MVILQGVLSVIVVSCFATATRSPSMAIELDSSEGVQVTGDTELIINGMEGVCIDYNVYISDVLKQYNVQNCMQYVLRGYTNYGDVAAINQATPSPKEYCRRWKELKKCFSEVVRVANKCWGSGYRISALLDQLVNLMCGGYKSIGSSKSSQRLKEAPCLQRNGTKLKSCLESSMALHSNTSLLGFILLGFESSDAISKYVDPICIAVNILSNCLRKYFQDDCKQYSSKKVYTSMLRRMRKAIKCEIKLK